MNTTAKPDNTVRHIFAVLVGILVMSTLAIVSQSTASRKTDEQVKELRTQVSQLQTRLERVETDIGYNDGPPAGSSYPSESTPSTTMETLDTKQPSTSTIPVLPEPEYSYFDYEPGILLQYASEDASGAPIAMLVYGCILVSDENSYGVTYYSSGDIVGTSHVLLEWDRLAKSLLGKKVPSIYFNPVGMRVNFSLTYAISDEELAEMVQTIRPFLSDEELCP